MYVQKLVVVAFGITKVKLTFDLTWNQFKTHHTEIETDQLITKPTRCNIYKAESVQILTRLQCGDLAKTISW